METSESSIVDPGSILSYLILKEEHRWPRPLWRGIYRTLCSVSLVFLNDDPSSCSIHCHPEDPYRLLIMVEVSYRTKFYKPLVLGGWTSDQFIYLVEGNPGLEGVLFE